MKKFWKALKGVYENIGVIKTFIAQGKSVEKLQQDFKDMDERLEKVEEKVHDLRK